MKATKKQIREAFANYIGSEGCDCCRGKDHQEHQDILAKMLGIPRYSDNSGNDYSQFKTKTAKNERGV